MLSPQGGIIAVNNAPGRPQIEVLRTAERWQPVPLRARMECWGAALPFP